MNICKKIIVFPLIIGNLILSSCAEEDKHILLTLHSGAENKTYVYSVNDERLNSVPNWESPRDAVPLSVRDACLQAEKWVTKSWPESQYELNYAKLEYDLIESKGESIKVWHYEISFQDSLRRRKRAVVLLDGSIVEPKIKNKSD